MAEKKFDEISSIDRKVSFMNLVSIWLVIELIFILQKTPRNCKITVTEIEEDKSFYIIIKGLIFFVNLIQWIVSLSFLVTFFSYLAIAYDKYDDDYATKHDWALLFLGFGVKSILGLLGILRNQHNSFIIHCILCWTESCYLVYYYINMSFEKNIMANYDQYLIMSNITLFSFIYTLLASAIWYYYLDWTTMDMITWLLLIKI